MDIHTNSLSLSPLVSTASRTVNVLVTTELCLEPSRDVATARIVTYNYRKFKMQHYRPNIQIGVSLVLTV